MVDPVNLNVPGLPLLLFALAFFAVVILLSRALSPIELAIRYHRRSDGGGGGGGRSRDDDAVDPGTDQPFRSVRDPTGADSRSATTVYECRRCGTTLDAGDGQCPHCETTTVARYEIA